MRTNVTAIRILLMGIVTGWTAETTLGVVKDLRHYRLGEADVPAAIPLGSGDLVTQDSSGGVPAEKIGLTFYHAKGGGVGPPVPSGLAVGSDWAMRFTNIDSRYVAPAVPGLLDNFGIEAYVKVSDPSITSRYFYNGHPGTFAFDAPLIDGFGLGTEGGQYVAVIGDSPTPVTIFSGIPVTNKAAQTALVRDDGTWKFFVNHKLALTFNAPAPTPTLASDRMSMGNFFDSPLIPPNPPNFAGILDEARVFTFLPGEFDSKTDLGPDVAGGFGDLNGDGSVDAADAGVMFAHWGEPGIGDLTEDGVTDAADAGVLFENWTGDPRVSAIPEPSALALMKLTYLGFAFWRKRRFPSPDCQQNHR